MKCSVRAERQHNMEGQTEIPQPLVVKGGVSSYPSSAAVICELAMRLFANTNFTQSTNINQAAKDAVARATAFSKVAGGLIDEMVVK